MQTLKTAVVVVLLLFVLYGGYVALNGTDTPLKPELEELVGLETLPDVSGPSGPFASQQSAGSSKGFEAFGNAPATPFGSNTNAPSSGSPFGSAFFGNSAPAIPPATSSVNSVPSLISANSPSSIPDLPPLPDFNSPSSSNSFPPLPSSSASNSFPAKNPTTNVSKSSGDAVAFPPTLIPSNETKPGTSSSSSPSLAAAFPSAGAGSISPNKSWGNSPRLAESAKILDNSGTSSFLPADSAPSSIKGKSASKPYENAKELAMEQVQRGDLKDALATLSTFYNAPELTQEQRSDLLDLLDALSREVVFSRRHFLDSVYVVAPGETLSDVAKRYDVPPEIIARINAMDATAQLSGGAKLKVVPGPFRAEVDLATNELTVFLGDLYAGRYPVAFGSDPAPKPGLFQVIDKQKTKNYYGNGVQIASNDPRNPYGGYWIDLGQDVCIHGTSDGPGDSKLGCISLSPLDASDIFGMLGRGSPVTIRR